MYIEKSFDTIFNMGYGGGVYNAPPHTPNVIAREKAHDLDGSDVVKIWTFLPVYQIIT